MSDLCCKEVSLRVNPSGFISCSTEDPIWLEPDTDYVDINEMAYAPLLGVLMALRVSTAAPEEDITVTSFDQYDDDTNEMVERASVIDYINSNIVYDDSAFRFVCASPTFVYVYDPVTQLVSNPIPITFDTCTDAINLIYVNAKSKTYGQFKILGDWWMCEIDLLTNTATQLGLCSNFWFNLTYSPVTDCIYGTTDGNSLKKFSLNTNSETTVAAVAGYGCGWDSDRDLLVCFGTVITEINTATEVATVTNPGTSALFNPTKTPIYVSSLHKFYIVGRSVYDVITLDRDNLFPPLPPITVANFNEWSVYFYDTQTQLVQDTNHDVSYTGLVQIDDSALFATIYANHENEVADPEVALNTTGFKKLCVHGMIEPWFYFKSDEGGVFEIPDDGTLIEERNGTPEMGWSGSNLAGFPALPINPGKIESCWDMSVTDGYVSPTLLSYPNPYSRYPMRRYYNLGEKDWTLRFWLRLPDVTDRWHGPLLRAFGLGHWNFDFNLEEQDPGPPPDPPINLIYGSYYWDSDTGSTYDVVHDTGGRSTDWHRIITWYKAGVEFGMKYDDEASQTVPVSTTPLRFDPDLHFTGSLIAGGGPDSGGHQWDEVCVMKGIAWTEEEMTLDWNDGRGRTWSQETQWEYPDEEE